MRRPPGAAPDRLIAHGTSPSDAARVHCSERRSIFYWTIVFNSPLQMHEALISTRMRAAANSPRLDRRAGPLMHSQPRALRVTAGRLACVRVRNLPPIRTGCVQTSSHWRMITSVGRWQAGLGLDRVFESPELAYYLGFVPHTRILP